jgi:hypothetical protein
MQTYKENARENLFYIFRQQETLAAFLTQAA